MPPSILRPALHSKRPSILLLLPHTTTTTHRPATICLPQVRRIVTTETAHKPKLDIHPLPGRPKSDPLRILFCGSDHFSCASLSALHALHKAEPHLIDSIDVLVRPGKPAGRGLKRIAVGPLFHLAAELNLPLHQRDTFTGWDLPLPGRVTHPKTGETVIHPHPTRPHRPHGPFNLLIAVSFGLFVPPRILHTLKYGGLNIHPSLLPDLRGPAPIQWALLLNRTHTGCTLQTLHPTAFDHGAILLQTPPPGLPIPPGSTTTAADLLPVLAAEGANMLVQGLRNNLHVPPHAPLPSPATTTLLRDAPKITKADLTIDWTSSLWARDHALYPCGAWTASDLARRFRALSGSGGGSKKGLWTHAVTAKQPHEQRLIFEDVEAVACPATLREAVGTIVQVKLAAGGGGGAPGQRRPPFPRDVGNVVFASQPDHGVEGRGFRVPVMVVKEGGGESSVVVPVRVPYRVVDGVVEVVPEEEGQCDAVRVRKIKVEGKASEEASRALAPFWERDVLVEDLVGLEYAMDVIAKRV